MKTFGVVIPTKGRPSIVKAIESLRETEQEDEDTTVIVVYDDHGPTPEGYMTYSDIIRTFSGRLDMNIRFYSYSAGFNDWGYPQLNHVYKEKSMELGVDYLMNIGDDDIMIPGVASKILEVINSNDIQPFMFQAKLYPSSHRGNNEPVIIWNDEDRSLTRKKITGQNLLVPNVPLLMGPMVDDFTFIKLTIEKWHRQVLWVPIVTCACF